MGPGNAAPGALGVGVLSDDATHLLTPMEKQMSDPMILPPSTDARWLRVAEGKVTRTWSNLAMKILMTRILRETAQDPSSANVQKCAGEIHAFFQKNCKIASDDLAAVLC
jgi:hypothetical protein